MDLRERKPLQSPCVITVPEDPNFTYKGPIEEAFTSTEDTPKIRLSKAKDADNRLLGKLQKRLNKLAGDADHCEITFQKNFCGLVERCHGMERSDSWAKPELMTRLDYFLGFEKPGMLNLDTRWNFWRGAVNLHRPADRGGFGWLPLLEVLKVVLEYGKEILALKDSIDSRRSYEEALKVVQSQVTGTFPYDMLPILMDEYYPIAQKPAHSIGPQAADTTNVAFHVHPFDTIGVLHLHLSPPFAILDTWEKIKTHGQKRFWTDSQSQRVQLIMDIMDIWQECPPREFLARKPPAPTPRGQTPNGDRDIRIDYSTPSRTGKGKATALSQRILGNLVENIAASKEPSHGATDLAVQPSQSHIPAGPTALPSSSGAGQPTTLEPPPFRSEKSKGKQKAIFWDDVDVEAPKALSPVLEEDEDTAPNGNDSVPTTIIPSHQEEKSEEGAGQPPIPTTSAPSVPKQGQREKKRRAQDVDDDVDKPKVKRTKKNPPSGDVAAPEASTAPRAYLARACKAKVEDKTEEVKPKTVKAKKARKKK